MAKGQMRSNKEKKKPKAEWNKKKKGGQVRFVLQERQGATFQQAVEDGDVLACLERGV